MDYKMRETARLAELKAWALGRDGKPAGGTYSEPATDRFLQVYRNEALNLMKAGSYNEGAGLFEAYVELHYPQDLEKLVGKLERSYESLERFNVDLLEEGFYNLVLSDIPLHMEGAVIVLLRAKEAEFPAIYNNDQDADMRSSPHWLLEQAYSHIWVDMHQTALNNKHYPHRML